MGDARVFVTVREVVARWERTLRLRETFVRGLCDSGELKAFRVGKNGRRIRIDLESVERYEREIEG